MTVLAVVDDPAAAVETLTNLTDDPVAAVTHDGIACVGTAGAGQPGIPDGAALAHRDDLIRALMRACTVLPFRYGTVVAETTSMEWWLAERASTLGRSLDRVRGRVEMAVRAAVPDPDPGPPADPTGRQYLEALRRSRRPDRRLEEMHLTIAAEVDEACVDRLDSRRLVAAYLIGADQSVPFRSVVEAAAAGSGVGPVCSVTGPWAPYSFTGVDEVCCGTEAR